jgi:hypothetical protein
MLVRVLSLGFLLGAIPFAAMAVERPVVVELFTSEGCSSCPPADRFLTELAQRRDVLPLAFHVTYWNSLGWADPFSMEVATQRQAQYGARFGDGSYTPEMVVDGEKGLVGSDRDAAEVAIATAQARDRTAAPISPNRQGGLIAIRIGAGSGSGRVVLVGFDSQHQTAVGRGENSGRTLLESNIVRSIRVVGQWTGAPLTLDEAAPMGQDAAVLLEEPSGRIVGASRAAGSQ